MARKKKQAPSEVRIPDAVRVPIEQLKPHPRNYKQHPDDQLEHIRASLKAFGFYRNVVVARDLTILAGHGVVQASRQMGATEVPVVKLDLDPGEPRALKVLALDNEVGRFAESDDRALTEILKSLRDSGEGLLGTGYDDENLAALLMVTRPASEVRNMDEAAHWVGMPEYDAGQKLPCLIVHFPDEVSRARFCEQHGIKTSRTGLHGGDGGPKTWSARWPFEGEVDASAVRFKAKRAAGAR